MRGSSPRMTNAGCKLRALKSARREFGNHRIFTCACRFEGLLIEMESFMLGVFLNVRGVKEWVTQDLFHLLVGEDQPS